MVERFISFYPMAYPPCRLEFVNNPRAVSKDCFTTADNEMLDDEERFRRCITYIISESKIEKFIDIFREGECTNASCPSQEKVLYCRFSLGDLSDEEAELFKQKSDIANHSDFILQSEADISLDTSEERYEHQVALNRFVKLFALYSHNPCRYDWHFKYMKQLRQIAETIRRSRPNTLLDQPASKQNVPSVVIEESLIEPIEELCEIPTIFIAASGQSKSKPKKSLIEKYNESIPQIDEPDEVLIKNTEPIAVRDTGAARDMLWAIQMSKHPDEKIRHWAMSESGIRHVDIAKTENPTWEQEYGQEEARKMWASEGERIRMQLRSVKNMLEKRAQT